jgi:HSP20 family protein
MISTQMGSRSDLTDLAQKVNQIMDQFMQKSLFRFRPCERWQPAINLYETPEGFTVCIDLAGVDPKEVEIRAERNVLYIIGKRETPATARMQGPRIHVMEIDHGPFYRAVSIPENVEIKKIEAKYTNGFLWVELPKEKNE